MSEEIKINNLQANADLSTMLNMISESLVSQDQAVKDVNTRLNTVGRESLELHKANNIAIELLNHHADLLDTVNQNQRQLETLVTDDLAKQNQIVLDVKTMTDDLASQINDRQQTLSDQLTKLSDQHQETVSRLTNLTESNQQAADHLSDRLARIDNNLVSLDTSKEIEQIENNVEQLKQMITAANEQANKQDQILADKAKQIQASFATTVGTTDALLDKADLVSQTMASIDHKLDAIAIRLAAIVQSGKIDLQQNQDGQIDIVGATQTEPEVDHDRKTKQESNQDQDPESNQESNQDQDQESKQDQDSESKSKSKPKAKQNPTKVTHQKAKHQGKED